MMSLWDALRMNMMISYQELVRTFPMRLTLSSHSYIFILNTRALFLLAVQGKYINSAGEGEESGIILL